MTARRKIQSKYFLLPIVSFIIFVALANFFMPSSVKAHTIIKSTPLPDEIGHVTIIILDMSALMSTSDPGGLRCSAANSFIDLSGTDDLIGVIGLDNNDNSRGGTYGFQQAQVWIQPTQVNTPLERTKLQQNVAVQSHKCQADTSGSTPTYDALYRALTMLTATTQAGQLSGSVILLTDSVPFPDRDSQITAIKRDLLPQFKQHKWPIDTIALGSETDFHSFLGELANGTSGKSYDDNNGIVPGVSSLNIAPFFVDIYARYSDRTVGPDIGPTQLKGGTQSFSFQPSDYADYLDIIVVKEKPNTKITLTVPGGETLTSAVAGTFVSVHDPYYAVFSVQGPKSGDWQLNVTGTGKFLMDSLILSSLKVSITLPGTNTTEFPLGNRLTLSATITDQGELVGNLTVKAKVTYAGSSSSIKNTTAPEYNVILSDNASSGTYLAQITVPETAPAGSYEIAISASGISSIVIASAYRSIRLERFPEPFVLSPQTNQFTSDQVNYTIMRWDSFQQWLFGLRIGLSRWPIENWIAQPSVTFPIRIEFHGKPYHNATVTATVTQSSSNTHVPVQVQSDRNGDSNLLFSPDIAEGTYKVTFRTSGTFEDSYGDLDTIQRTIHIIRPIYFIPEIIVWFVLVLYLIGFVFSIIFFISLLRFLPIRHPFGACMKSEQGIITARYDFSKANYNIFTWFFWCHVLKSHQVQATNSQMKLYAGLKFRFRWGYIIEVRPYGRAGTLWKRMNGTELSKNFHKEKHLVYHSSHEDNSKPITFTIEPR